MQKEKRQSRERKSIVNGEGYKFDEIETDMELGAVRACMWLANKKIIINWLVRVLNADWLTAVVY